jgi:hypothetical protein
LWKRLDKLLDDIHEAVEQWETSESSNPNLFNDSEKACLSLLTCSLLRSLLKSLILQWPQQLIQKFDYRVETLIRLCESGVELRDAATLRCRLDSMDSAETVTHLFQGIASGIHSAHCLLLLDSLSHSNPNATNVSRLVTESSLEMSLNFLRQHMSHSLSCVYHRDFCTC